MDSWTWPEGTTITLFHWRWVDTTIHQRLHGWSLAAEVGPDGYVHLEAERGQAPLTCHVDAASPPAIDAHTFQRLAELPNELIADDGRPLRWVRVVIMQCAGRWVPNTQPFCPTQ